VWGIKPAQEPAQAEVIKREWTIKGALGRNVKHVAYGFALMINGKRERKVCSTWEAEALTARLKEIDAGQLDRLRNATLRELADEYLTYKEQHGKRSISEDRRILNTRYLQGV
jgi:hypothetical protein